jgi:hypothetical protein
VRKREQARMCQRHLRTPTPTHTHTRTPTHVLCRHTHILCEATHKQRPRVAQQRRRGLKQRRALANITQLTSTIFAILAKGCPELGQRGEAIGGVH